MLVLGMQMRSEILHAFCWAQDNLAVVRLLNDRSHCNKWHPSRSITEIDRSIDTNGVSDRSHRALTLVALMHRIGSAPESDACG